MPDFLVTSFSPTTSLSNSESWLQVESDIDGESTGDNTYTVQTPDLQPDVTWQYGNSVYHLFKEGKSWAEAKVSAEMIGGYLVEIDSIGENNQLFAKVLENLIPVEIENTIGIDGGKAPYIWLGGTDGDTTSTQERNESIVNDNVSSPHGISIENASYIENNIEVENTLDKVDAGTEHTPKLFSEEDSHNLEDEDLQNDKLFNQNSLDDEEFEIPAFLRKQKF